MWDVGGHHRGHKTTDVGQRLGDRSFFFLWDLEEVQKKHDDTEGGTNPLMEKYIDCFEWQVIKEQKMKLMTVNDTFSMVDATDERASPMGVRI